MEQSVMTPLALATSVALFGILAAGPLAAMAFLVGLAGALAWPDRW